ncbi:MAG: hypothetical protein AAFO02_24100 [Bacteroidota bacterium]
MSTDQVIILNKRDLTEILEEAISRALEHRQPPKPQWPEYLTKNQVANILGVHYNTIGNYVERGWLKPREGATERYSTKAVFQLWQDKRDLLV